MNDHEVYDDNDNTKWDWKMQFLIANRLSAGEIENWVYAEKRFRSFYVDWIFTCAIEGEAVGLRKEFTIDDAFFERLIKLSHQSFREFFEMFYEQHNSKSLCIIEWYDLLESEVNL